MTESDLNLIVEQTASQSCAASATISNASELASVRWKRSANFDDALADFRSAVVQAGDDTVPTRGGGGEGRSSSPVT
jgi:hypothetical protein